MTEMTGRGCGPWAKAGPSDMPTPARRRETPGPGSRDKMTSWGNGHCPLLRPGSLGNNR
jgi:hypothetical protein